MEFKDILVASSTPLHPHMADDARIFVRLIVDGKTRGETPSMSIDPINGVWETDTSFQISQNSEVIYLEILASKGDTVNPIASIKLGIPELLSQVMTQTDGGKFVYTSNHSFDRMILE